MEEKINFDNIVSNDNKKKKSKKVVEKKDPIVEKVLDFRGKGYDDNRIAAMLMISKESVQNIK